LERLFQQEQLMPGSSIAGGCEYFLKKTGTANDARAALTAG